MNFKDMWNILLNLYCGITAGGLGAGIYIMAKHSKEKLTLDPISISVILFIVGAILIINFFWHEREK